MGRENRGSGRENIFKHIIARDFIFSLIVPKIFGGRLSPDPLRSLSAAPDPITAVPWCHGREHSLV